MCIDKQVRLWSGGGEDVGGRGSTRYTHGKVSQNARGSLRRGRQEDLAPAATSLYTHPPAHEHRPHDVIQAVLVNVARRCKIMCAHVQCEEGCSTRAEYAGLTLPITSPCIAGCVCAERARRRRARPQDHHGQVQGNGKGANRPAFWTSVPEVRPLLRMSLKSSSTCRK